LAMEMHSSSSAPLLISSSVYIPLLGCTAM
jgi:hypothetical protein